MWLKYPTRARNIMLKQLKRITSFLIKENTMFPAKIIMTAGAKI